MKIKNKRCPRCGFKVEKTTNVCPRCRLNYIKFESATNQEAREAMRAGEKDRVVLRKGCPSDIKKWKLLLLTIFLGLCGGHHFYTGRKGWGIFYFVFFAIAAINAVVVLLFGMPKGDLYQLVILLVMVWGITLVLWGGDLIKVIFNKYKVPVSLPRV